VAAKGMTPAHPARRQRAPTDDAVLGYRFVGVLRAAGSEAAGRQAAGARGLVEVNRSVRHPLTGGLLHRGARESASSRCAARTAVAIVGAPGPIRIRSEVPGVRPPARDRSIARRRRRARLRSTADPTLRATANAIRGGSVEGWEGARTDTERGPDRAAGRRTRVANVPRPRTAQITLRACGDRARGGS
jgi:hypothetical protein